MRQASANGEMPPTVLHRVDHSRNMARFYVMSISPSLFGDAALVRSWGRMAKKGAFKIKLYHSYGEAEVARAKIIAQKLARGYKVGIFPAHKPQAKDDRQLDLFN